MSEHKTIESIDVSHFTVADGLRLMGVKTTSKPPSTFIEPSLAVRMSDQECDRWLAQAKEDHRLYASVPPSVLVYLVRTNKSPVPSTTAPAASSVKYNPTPAYRTIIEELEEAARRSR